MPKKPTAKKVARRAATGSTAKPVEPAEPVTEASATKAPAQAVRAEMAAAKKGVANKGATTKAPAEKALAKAPTSSAPKLLSGGNPQIGKGDGDAPVAAYLDALPGWKQGIGRRLDALVARTVPGVRRAVRWNTPFYGLAGQGWFLAFHCFDRYVKVTFFKGAALTPPPPVASKVPDVRYVHLTEDEPGDERTLRDWIRQAAALPGEDCF